MKEIKITVTIHKDGSIKSETKGIKGKKCVNELEELFKDIAEINSFQNTPEYFELEEQVTETKKVKVGN